MALSVVRRGTAVSSTTNATSWTPAVTFSLDGNVGGHLLWVCFIAADGAPTITETSGSNWVDRGQASQGSVVGAVFTKETVGVPYNAGVYPGLTFTSSASEQFSCTIYALQDATGINTIGTVAATSATGSSANSDPPANSQSSGAARACIVLAGRAGDSTVVATAAPTNYTNLLTATGGGTNGASTNSAERAINLGSGVSEDPGVFTSVTEQWVCLTHISYEMLPSSFPPVFPGRQYLPHLTR